MEQRAIGNCGISVTRLGLGTAAFTGLDTARADADPPRDRGPAARPHRHRAPADDNEAIAAIQSAIEAGITLLETDPAYGDGHGASLLAKALLGQRDKVVLMTRRVRPDGAPSGDRPGIYEHTVAQCERTLRRLRFDSIDIHTFGPPAPDAPLRETMRAMTELLDRGLIRAIGANGLDLEQLAAAREFGPIHCLQTEFSMLHRRPARDLIPFCVEHGIAVLACRSLAGGSLARRVRDSDGVAANSGDAARSTRGPRVDRALMAGLTDIAEQLDRPLAQLALNWTLCQPGVTSVVFGARRPSQVIENAGAAAWSLDEATGVKIARLLERNGR